MKHKIGDKYEVYGEIYVIVDFRILYPNGLLGEKFNEEPYSLLKEGTVINTLNGCFNTIKDLIYQSEKFTLGNYMDEKYPIRKWT